MARSVKLERKTRETNIALTLSLDGKGKSNINTGIGFLNHMLTSFSHHGGFSLELACKGDLDVDCHHTVEDIGIVLGQAFDKVLGDKGGISRFGSACLPMDEALATCNLDISNRPYLVFNAEFKNEKIGDIDTQMIKEFFYAFAMNAKITLHLNLQYGENDHHIAECLFKVFAYAMKEGVKLNESGTIVSTKGSL